MDDPREVGLRLKHAREASGLSQRTLAFPGCSPAYISRIEAGERIPSLQILRELGSRLDVDADYLATGAGGPAGLARTIVDAEIALRLDEFDQAEAGFARAIEQASGYELARAAAGLGEIALRRGFPDEAIAYLERAANEHGGAFARVAGIAENLGRAYAAVDRLPEAIATFRRGLAEQEAAGDLVQVLRFACSLAYALVDEGELAEAETVLADSLKRASGMADARSRARLYWAQARQLGDNGHADESARYALLTLETLRVGNDTYTLAQAHQFLAHLHLDAGQVTDAQAQLDAGRPLIAAAATPTQRALYELEEARLHAQRGETNEARAAAERLGNQLSGATPHEAGRAHFALGEIYESLGEFERSSEMYKKAIAQLEQLPTSRYLLKAQRRLAAVLEGLDRPDLALEALKKALGVQERLTASSE